MTNGSHALASDPQGMFSKIFLSPKKTEIQSHNGQCGDIPCLAIDLLLLANCTFL